MTTSTIEQTAPAPVRAGSRAASTPAPVARRPSPSRVVRKALGNGLGLLLALVWAFPIYWMVNSSLQTDESLYASDPQFFPNPFTGENFDTVVSDPTFWAAMRMSAMVTAMAVVVALLSATLAAAALSRFRFKGRGAVILTILIIQMIPAEALFISQYRMLDGWGLINSAIGLAVLYAGHSVPITIWMIKGFVDGVPYELEEAGCVDGCSRVGAFWRITLPLLAPGLVASGIFALLAAWNEYTLALVVMKDNWAATLPLWLKRFNTSYEATDWGGIMAGSALIAIPVIVVFLIVQGRMATGLVAGAVKG